MQSYFPAQNREVRINSDENDNVFHIADVFIEGKEKNMIIEFQHSSITSKEFEERNEFYSYNNTKKDRNGNKIPNDVIWIFDYRDKRIFTVLSDNPNDFHLELARENDVCKNFKKEENRYRKIYNRRCVKFKEDDYTQTSNSFNGVKYAKINWENPSKIFYDLSSNIYIYFDIYQRRFICNTYKYENKNFSKTQETFKFLSEICSYSKLNDIMSEFLLFIPNNEELDYPNCIVGKCLEYEDFFKEYNSFIKENI